MSNYIKQGCDWQKLVKEEARLKKLQADFWMKHHHNSYHITEMQEMLAENKQRVQQGLPILGYQDGLGC